MVRSDSDEENEPVNSGALLEEIGDVARNAKTVPGMALLYSINNDEM